MQDMFIVWQAASQSQNNEAHFRIIANWWKSLDNKQVLWKQRLIPETGAINWDHQRFDETFALHAPDVRGVSFYWQKSETEESRNITPAKLEFNPAKQHVYLYPATQANLVISVEIPGAIRESLQMKNPAWFSERISNPAGDVSGYRLIIHDMTNLVEVEIEMDGGSLNYLKHAVNTL